MVDRVEPLTELLRSSASRFLVAAEGGPWEQGPRHLHWSPSQIVAHLATICDYFSDIVSGAGSSVPSLRALTESNAAGLTVHLGNPWQETLGHIATVVDDVGTQLSLGRQESYEWHGGIELGTTETLGVLAGEFLIHEWDLARTLGVSPALTVADCRTLIPALHQVLPHVLDEGAAEGLDCRWRIHISGIDVFDVHIANARMTVGSPNGRPDCHIRANALAFLLAAYKRVSVVKAGFRGQAVAYGRRPLLGLKLTTLLEVP